MTIIELRNKRAMVFLWKYGVRPFGGVLDIYELLPAFICDLAANICVSLATQKASAAELKSIEKEFSDAVASEG